MSQPKPIDTIPPHASTGCTCGNVDCAGKSPEERAEMKAARAHLLKLVSAPRERIPYDSYPFSTVTRFETTIAQLRDDLREANMEIGRLRHKLSEANTTAATLSAKMSEAIARAREDALDDFLDMSPLEIEEARQRRDDAREQH